MRRAHELCLLIPAIVIATPLALMGAGRIFGEGLLSSLGYLAGILFYVVAIPVGIALLLSLIFGIVELRRQRREEGLSKRTCCTYFVIAAFWAALLCTPVALLILWGHDEDARKLLAAQILGGLALFGLFWAIPLMAKRPAKPA
jgi:hypothetical protein